jgi:hypothetical protein
MRQDGASRGEVSDRLVSTGQVGLGEVRVQHAGDDEVHDDLYRQRDIRRVEQQVHRHRGGQAGGGQLEAAARRPEQYQIADPGTADRRHGPVRARRGRQPQQLRVHDCLHRGGGARDDDVVQGVGDVLRHLEPQAGERAEDHAVQRSLDHPRRRQHDHDHAAELEHLLVQRRRQGVGPTRREPEALRLGPQRREAPVGQQGAADGGRGPPDRRGRRPQQGRVADRPEQAQDEETDDQQRDLEHGREH